MESHPRISELLVASKGFNSLKEPVIFTGGELGAYYVNTEKLCLDGGKFEEYGDDSKAMIEHAVRMMDEHPTFREVIDILSEKAETLLRRDYQGLTAISGGQRRDWIFSGPVAHQLQVPHISLYKQEGNTPDKVEVVYPGGKVRDYSFGRFYNPHFVVHAVDLITEGSSVYRTEGGIGSEDGIEKGWVPMIRQKGGEVRDLIAVVTRNQGGEEMLASRRVKVHPFVAIDEAFLKEHSPNAERDIAYLRNPRKWSEDYLREHGALLFVDHFNPDPENSKFSRALKFLDRYQEFLARVGEFGGLLEAIKRTYGAPLAMIKSKRGV